MRARNKRALVLLAGVSLVAELQSVPFHPLLGIEIILRLPALGVRFRTHLFDRLFRQRHLFLGPASVHKNPRYLDIEGKRARRVFLPERGNGVTRIARVKVAMRKAGDHFPLGQALQLESATLVIPDSKTFEAI